MSRARPQRQPARSGRASAVTDYAATSARHHRRRPCPRHSRRPADAAVRRLVRRSGGLEDLRTGLQRHDARSSQTRSASAVIDVYAAFNDRPDVFDDESHFGVEGHRMAAAHLPGAVSGASEPADADGLRDPISTTQIARRQFLLPRRRCGRQPLKPRARLRRAGRSTSPSARRTVRAATS